MTYCHYCGMNLWCLICSFGSHAANDGGQSAVLVTSSFPILGLEHHAQRVEKRVMMQTKTLTFAQSLDPELRAEGHTT